MMNMKNLFMAPDGVSGSAAAAANVGASSNNDVSAGVDIETKAKANGSTSKAKIDTAGSKKQPAVNKIVVSAKAGTGFWKLILGFLIGIVLMLVIYFAAIRTNTKKIPEDIMQSFGVIGNGINEIGDLAGENVKSTDLIGKSQEKIIKYANAIVDEATTTQQESAKIGERSKKQQEVVKTVEKEVEKVEDAVKEVVKETSVKKDADGSFIASTGSGTNVSGPIFPASGSNSKGTDGFFNSPVAEIKNTLNKDIYGIFYGDWDGGVIVKLSPGESLKPGFDFGNGRKFCTGVHFNLFSLDNVKKGKVVEYDLNRLYRYDDQAKAWRPLNTSLGTYYWASGCVPVRDGYYKDAMSILTEKEGIVDGQAKKRKDNTVQEVVSGGHRFAARNM